MIGVVLWKDEDQRKAVIWCEDHGDLAFYSNASADAGVSLDPGDMVQFDVTVDRDLRLAHNPRLVQEASHSGLSDALTDTLGTARQSGAVDTPCRMCGPSNVIPFSLDRCAQNEQTAPVATRAAP